MGTKTLGATFKIHFNDGTDREIDEIVEKFGFSFFYFL